MKLIEISKKLIAAQIFDSRAEMLLQRNFKAQKL